MEDLILKQSEMDSLYQLYLYAFNRQDNLNRRDFFVKRASHGKVFRIKDKEQQNVVSALYRLPFEITLNHQNYQMGGVGDVMTYPEYGGNGYASKLLKTALQDMYDEGYELSFLAPFAHRYYRRFGYEQVENKITYEIAVEDLSPFKNTKQGYVTRETLKDGLQYLTKFYTENVAVQNGKLHRKHWWWDYLTIKNNWDVAIYFDENKQVQGYLIYERQINRLIVHEFQYQNMTAYEQLINFVCAHGSMFEKFIFEDYSDKYQGFRSLEPAKIKTSVEPYMMGRIVNFEKFISKYPFKNDFNSICIQVEDDFLAVNDTKWEVGIQKCIQTEKEWQLKGKINDLAAIFLGAMPLSVAIQMEKIQVQPLLTDELNQFENALITEPVSFSDYF